MLNFQMNMPYYLMAFYGSIMILAVLLLRVLLKNRLPKFVFPVLWAGIILRLLIPFSLSSPLSMRVPEWFMLSPFEAVTTDSVTAVSEDPPAPGSAFMTEKGGIPNIAQVAEEVSYSTAFEIAYTSYHPDSFLPAMRACSSLPAPWSS